LIMWCNSARQCSTCNRSLSSGDIQSATIQQCDLMEAIGKDRAVVVDMECLIGECNNEMVVKELALYNHRCVQMYQFQPPYAITGNRWSQFRKNNQWLKQRLNGLNWYDGQIHYTEMNKILKHTATQFPLILTKGLQKRKLIWSIIGDKYPDAQVINLEDFDCPNFKHINAEAPRCQFHSTKNREDYQCAVEKAGKYFHWVQKLGNKDQQQQQDE
jgi:hypothetical protein